MKKTLNIIPPNPDLVLIALNPTKEAIENKAVFSRDKAFWNLLTEAGIIDDVSHIKLKERAVEVFEKQNHCKVKLGFADLLPFVDETNSRKVKVHKNAAKVLFEQNPNLKNAKKIALLGQKVVDGFALVFTNLKKWKDIEIIENKKQFGKIGSIEINNNSIEVYAMPFPINNSIPDKSDIYKKLL
jgi:hypothetical protein